MQAHALTIDIEAFSRHQSIATPEKDLKAFKIAMNITGVWGLSDAEKSAVFDMTIEEVKGSQPSIEITTDGRSRISLILGIHKALSNLFVHDRHKLEWLNNPNRAFADYSPKDIICSGALLGLYDVRKYLDTARS